MLRSFPAVVLIVLQAACATPHPALAPAQTAERGGQRAVAIELYTRVLAEQPNDRQARAGLVRNLVARARSRASAGYEDAALADLEAAVSIQQTHSEAQRMRAELRLRRGDPPGSVATELEALVTLRPADVPARVLLARIYNDTGDQASEREHLLRCTGLGDVSPEVRVALARALLRSGNPDLADTELRRALAEDEIHAPALLALSELRTHQGRHADAIAALERAVRGHPANAELRERLEALHKEQEDGTW